MGSFRNNCLLEPVRGTVANLMASHDVTVTLRANL